MVESTGSQQGLRIAIIGSTGAIGVEIVDHLKKDSRFSEVILICRRDLEGWSQENFLAKLTIIKMSEFD